MKRKFISSLLVLVLIVGAFAQFDKKTYAATTEAFSLAWNQNKKISDIINIANRTETNNELVLNWAYGKVAGNDYNGNYVMTYHLKDGEDVEITVNRASDAKTKIEYRIKKYDINPDNTYKDSFTYKDANLLAYDENSSKAYWQYHKSSATWLKENSTSEVWSNSTTGAITLPKSVFAPSGIEVNYNVLDPNYGANITIDKNKAVAFKYDGKLVTLKWETSGSTSDSGNIYLGIEGIEQSKIYNFNVKTDNAYSNYINVIKLLNFEVNPVGESIIDKAVLPTAYAGEKPELNVKFEIPQVWNDDTKKYDNSGSDKGKYSDTNKYNGLKATVELKTSQSGDAIQVDISDIYNTGTLNVTSTAGNVDPTVSTIGIDPVNNKKYYSFGLKSKVLKGEGIKSSSLYTIATVSIGATASHTVTERSKLYSIAATLSSGDNAYTHLEYDVETKGNGERVLKIKPYNVSGTYYIHMAKTDTELPGSRNKFEITDTVIAKYDYLVSSGIDKIEVPVVNNGRYYYMVEFVYEKGVIPSQIVFDNPDNAYYLTTPELEVKDYKIITQTTDNKVTEKLKVVLSWSGGNADNYDSLVKDIGSLDKEVKYTFAKTPFAPREDNYTDFLVIATDKNGENYDLNLVGTNSENGAAMVQDWGNYKTGATIKVSTSSANKEIREIVFTAVLEFDIFNNDNLGSRNEPSKIFYYPSVYYMKMKGTYLNVTGEPKQTAYCNPVNVTLDEKSKTILPPPQNVTTSNITSKAFNINWSTVAGSVYSDYIQANNYSIDPKGASVNIFITQKNILSQTDAAKQLAYFTDTSNIKEVEFESLSKIVNGVVTLDIAQNTTIMTAMRNNKMIKIVNVPQSLDLKTQVVNTIGLDKNIVYYTALQTLLNVVNITDGQPKQVVSDTVSQILSLTTKKEDVLEEPNPSEVAPKSPSDFREDTEAEQAATKVTLIWTEVEDTKSINEINIKKEYEIIRVDKKLEDTLLSKRNNFDTFWSADLKNISNAQKVAWQTDSTKPSLSNLLIYSGSDFTLDTVKTQDKYSYEYEEKNPTLQFVDNTLLPNKIYYYYIRTVRMTEGEDNVYTEAAYSSWEPVVITTNPIEAPNDLKLERNTTYFSYDKEKEVAISFFAAIPVGTPMSGIASLYPLEYAIMQDGGQWKTIPMDVTNSSLFKLGNVKKSGYQQFVYKISDLEQGKGYSVRVRMKSRINPITEATAMYDISLYSNTVEFRTDMNQEDYDTEEGIKKWLGLYDEALLDSSKKAYWVTNNSSSRYEAIYRTTTFGGELQKATSGVYQFESNGQDKQTYYIPAKALISSNNANIGFKLVHGDMEIIIRPNSLDANTTEAIGNVLSKIKDKSVKDYYIKIEANWYGSKDTINSSAPLSDEVKIEVSVVGSKELEKTLDAGFVEMFAKAISDTSNLSIIRNELKIDLKAGIKTNVTNEELYKLVMDAVGETYDALIDGIEDDFDNKIKYNHSVYSLGENMIITAATSGTNTVSGYRKNNTAWESIPTNHYGTKKGIETKLLGIFVFAGNSVNMPDISGIPNSAAVKELIAKYGLGDYFGKDSINVNANATKYMVVGSIARILGAAPTQSEITYLKNKGVNVTSGKMYNAITNQEALYLVMSLYEMKTATKVSTIRISNYNAVPDIALVDANYKKSVQAAAQLGIYNHTTRPVNSTITVRTLLEYLGNLSKKIKM